ncbi:MAG TPA: carboxypeptidase-like regulatory domain-containing protein [Thermoanaerobaculia bacterium]|nr:carboxypeptidase-like regulatory domain-containing protein [Thermoanaerobaculia bacterium]
MNARHLWCTAIFVFCAVTVGAASEETASLRVRWPSAAVERPEKLSLLPIDVALPAGISRDNAIRMWTRPIIGSEQQWNSLPAGTYRIIVRSANTVPVEVGEVILSPGEERTVPIELPLVPASSAQPAAGTLRVLIREPIDAESLRVAHWRDGARVDLAATRQQQSAGTLLTMQAPCIPGSVVMIESPTKIGVASLDGACTETLHVPLAERATLTARIAVSGDASVPRSGSLRFAKCAGDASMEIPFAISDSRMRTSVPAGCGEMSAHATGLVPMRVSHQPLKAGENGDAGTIVLREGAAAVLHVRAGSDAVALAGVRITAVRPGDLATMRGQLDAEPVALGKTTSDVSGWARLAGLPEGRVIFLLHGAGRKRPQVSEPYELRAGEETVIDDLVVETPANVFVTVSVPADLQDDVELHAVELTGTGHTHWPSRVPMRAEPDAAGTVVEDVPPGTWRVRATGRLRNGFALNLGETTIDVAPGVDRHVTLTVNDTLYHGRVTRGGLAVRGTINLTPADERRNRRAAVAKLGPDGDFQVLLESKGDYRVFVQDSSRATVRLGRPITFDDPEDEVEIELPAGQEIRGRVVDASGSPVAGVSIGATQQLAEPAGFIGFASSTDGTFTLDGVVAGRWELTAESTAYRSAPSMIDVGTGDVDGVTLVVESTRTVKVRVVDMTGAPLRSVNVTTAFLAPGTLQPQFQGNLTRATGEVELRLSTLQQRTPTSVIMQSLADGTLSCTMRTLDSDQTIQVQPHAGELRLLARRWIAKAAAQKWLVSASGCAVPFLAKAEDDSDGLRAMVFRRLASGTWKYVETRNPQELAAVLEGRGSMLIPIKTFVVEAGKTTRVVLPEGAS